MPKDDADAQHYASALMALLHAGALSACKPELYLHTVTRLCARTLNLHVVSLWQGPDASGLWHCLTFYNRVTDTHSSRLAPACLPEEYLNSLRAMPLCGSLEARLRYPDGPALLPPQAGDARDYPIRAAGKLIGILHLVPETTDSLNSTLGWQFVAAVAEALAQALVSQKHACEVESLSQRLHRYRTLVSTVYEIVWVVNGAGEAQQRSPSWEQFTGQAPEDYSGWGWLAAIHPDDQPYWRNILSAQPPSFTTESRIRRHDGIYRIFQSRGVRIDDPDGQIREWVGCCIDITERREIEENLWWSENRHRTLVNAMSQIVWSVAPDFSAQSYSSSWQTFTGQSVQETKDRGYFSAFHPDDIERVLAYFQQVVRDEGSYEDEYRLRRHDGVYRYISSRGAPVRDTSGKIREWIGACTDITERKEAEAALRENEHRLNLYNHSLMAIARSKLIGFDDVRDSLKGIAEETAATLQVARVGVWLYDPGHSLLTCIEQYDCAQERHSEGIALSVTDYPDYFAALAKERAIAADDACNDPRTREFTDHYLRPLGIQSMLDAPIRLGKEIVGVLCCEHRGSLRNWRADEQSFVGSVADMISLALQYARRRDAEQALMKAHIELEERVAERTTELCAANEQLKQLDQLKSMFIASMSHELRTPLNSIIGFTGLMLQGLTGEINVTQRDQLQRVYSSGKHLLGLITDVIDISKIEAGYLESQLTEIDLDTLIDEAIAACAPQREAKGLRINELPATGLKLVSDRKRLLQCLLNVLSNAIKYTERGSIKVTVACDQEGICISVQDTGIGMNQESLAKLFRPFERLASHLHHNTQGTGLGLYLTRKILTEVLGGDISVQSESGQGSTFVIRVPSRVAVLTPKVVDPAIETTL